MLLGAIKDQIDTFIADNKDKLKSRQTQYFAKHGRYWQGVLTPVIPPDDGALSAPDLTLKASGFRSGWSHVLKGAEAWPATWPCSCRVDTSVGSSGHSWILTVFFTKNGKTHMRTRDFMGSNDTQWAQLPDPPAPPVIDENEDLP